MSQLCRHAVFRTLFDGAVCRLVALGVAPWESLAREADENAFVNDADTDSSRRKWTWPVLRRALWRVHRPAAMSWLPNYSIRDQLLGDVVAGTLLSGVEWVCAHLEFPVALVLQV